MEKFEQPNAGAAAQSDSSERMVQQALSTYHVCGDGRVVTNPKECQQSKFLPEIDTSNLSKA